MTVLSSEDYVNDKGVFKISLFLFNVVKSKFVGERNGS